MSNIIKNEQRTEIISLYYHNELSILSINRKYRRMFTMKQIARVIIESKMHVETKNFIIVESTLNYTNRL